MAYSHEDQVIVSPSVRVEVSVDFGQTPVSKVTLAISPASATHLALSESVVS